MPCGKQRSPEGWPAAQECGHILWDSVLGLEDNHESILNNLNCTEREEIRGSIFLTDNMSYQQLGGREIVEIVVQLL